MSLNFKHTPARRNTAGSSPEKAIPKGCLTPLVLGAVLTASPLLSLLMPERESQAKLDLPEPKLPPVPAEQVQKILPLLPWHNNIAPDKYAPIAKAWVVKPGDSIDKIARQYKVSPDLIMSLNQRYGAEANQIRPGEKLNLPSVRGIKLDEQGWHGKVFDLNLESKADWIYLCQNLLCCQTEPSPVRKEISCATQYMPSNLRRSFVEKICKTMREIASDEIPIVLKQGSDLPQLVQRVSINWPQKNFEKVCQIRQIAAAYSWALEAALQQRSERLIKGEDAFRDRFPHPFRIPPCAFIANIESLREIGFIEVAALSQENLPMPHSYFSISTLTGYPTARLEDIKSGRQRYGLFNCGTGDHNGVFSSAEIIITASRPTDVPELYIESYDGSDMITQCKEISKKAGQKPFSLVLAGHGNHTETGCTLQVGYTSWAHGKGGAAYYLSSATDAESISDLAQDTIFIYSCSSGAPTAKGLNFVDAVADAAGKLTDSKPRYIFGLNQPSNICDAYIEPGGSLHLVIGPENKHSYMREVE